MKRVNEDWPDENSTVPETAKCIIGFPKPLQGQNALIYDVRGKKKNFMHKEKQTERMIRDTIEESGQKLKVGKKGYLCKI